MRIPIKKQRGILMKKNILKIVALALVLVMGVAMLASCATKLSGSYSGELGGSLAGAKATYKFSGSKVTLTVTTTLLGNETSKAFEGTYEIIDNDDKSQSIKLTFEGDGSTSYSGTKSFEKGDGYINIAGIKYTKD